MQINRTMKTYFKISLLLLTVLLNISAKAQFTKADLQAAGLTCSMCSRAVDKQLHTLDFIDSVGIDLSQATFILFFKKDKIVDFDLIKKKVEDAGFSVASLKVTFQFTNLKVEENSHWVHQNTLYHFIHVKPQTLNGDATFKIISKGFVSDKEYKKYAKEMAVPVIDDGKVTDANKVFHITL